MTIPRICGASCQDVICSGCVGRGDTIGHFTTVFPLIFHGIRLYFYIFPLHVVSASRIFFSLFTKIRVSLIKTEFQEGGRGVFYGGISVSTISRFPQTPECELLGGFCPAVDGIQLVPQISTSCVCSLSSSPSFIEI